MKYYVVSDIHGFYSELMKTLKGKGFFEELEEHKLIICGDVFDRGQEAKLLQTVSELKNIDQFNEMIDACKRGEYDLIITKNIFSFAKNNRNFVSLVTELRNLPHPVGVFFKDEELFTLSKEAELILSTMLELGREEAAEKTRNPSGFPLEVRKRYNTKHIIIL